MANNNHLEVMSQSSFFEVSKNFLIHERTHNHYFWCSKNMLSNLFVLVIAIMFIQQECKKHKKKFVTT